MRGLVILLALIPVFCLNQLPAQNLQIDQPVRFLALGDSYTIGHRVREQDRWPVQLFDSLAQRGYQTDSLRIIAKTGWRTYDLSSALDAAAPDSGYYNLVSLLIGVNDQYQGSRVGAYVPRFEALLQRAIALAGGEKSRVFVVSIPDYAYTPYGQSTRDPNEISMDIDSFNTVNRDICRQYAIKYFDITPISRTGLSQPNLVANDGLHPSGLMYTKWVEEILKAIPPTQTTGIEPDKAWALIRLVHDSQGAWLMLESEAPCTIKIWSMEGKCMVSETETISMQFSWDFPHGVYFYEITNSQGNRQTGKLIY